MADTCPHPTLRACSENGRCPICEPYPIVDVVQNERQDPEVAPAIAVATSEPPPPAKPKRPRAGSTELAQRLHRAQVQQARADIARRAVAELNRRAAARARLSLAEFVKQAWFVHHGSKPLRWGPHLQRVCDHAQWWVEGWLGRYVDGREGVPLHVQDFDWNLPPGTLKSEILSVYMPAWLWLHEARVKFGCLSGTEKVWVRDSDACRTLVQSSWYRGTFGITWTIKPTADAVGRWETTAGGGRESQGMNADVTGMHVDILLCDDPEDSGKVHSASYRAERWRRWEAAGSRLVDRERSLRGVVQQRVHSDDFSGKRRKRGIPSLVLPARHCRKKRRGTPWMSADELEWRQAEGAPIASDFTAAFFRKEKVRLGTAGVAAQHEQDPEAEGGKMFARQWWRWFRLEGVPVPEGDPATFRPEGCNHDAAVVVRARRDARGDVRMRGNAVHYEFDKIVILVDATFGSEKETASRVGLLAVGLRGPDRYVLDDRSKRMDYNKTEAAVAAIAEDWGADAVIVERKANGQTIVDRMKSELSGVIPWDHSSGEDKVARAAAMSPSVESGNWYLLEGATWLERGCGDDDDEGLLPEVSTFPASKKNDRVDALSMGEAYARREGTGRARMKSGSNMRRAFAARLLGQRMPGLAPPAPDG